MRKLAFALFVTLSATTLYAQTQNVAPSAPDAARIEDQACVEDANVPVLVMIKRMRPPASDTQFRFGSFVMKRGNTTVRIAWLPILAPLPGSVPGTTHVMPTAFELLHTELPWRKGLRPASIDRWSQDGSAEP